MEKSVGRLLAVVGFVLLGALTAPVWAAPIGVGACGTYIGQQSYVLTADLVTNAGPCLTFTGNGTTLDLAGHSISGTPSSIGTASVGIRATGLGNNVTIKGPGIVHGLDVCIVLGRYALVESVLAYDCVAGIAGIQLGDNSKCVQCRLHDVRNSDGTAFGIFMGNGCLLESSIVETSDNGAKVGQDCKVWDLVVDSVAKAGLVVGAGTAVARSVISHFHNGPGLDYTACIAGIGCQDSSNSVALETGSTATAIQTPVAGVAVITDCATNSSGQKYVGAPAAQCPESEIVP